ncbi:MAG: hypothetical protein QOJ55_58 [Solirubrobacteraceae bacterium]|jgi:steroid delta-isomerase-like uncharacterized protein|nr:hypothetical protein [Solirubrobacteraceae bacterium]
MGTNDIAQVLKRETEAWNAHDADAVAACYAEDAVLYDVGLPEPVRGRAAIRDSVAGYLAAFSDFQAVDVGDPVVSGNRAAQEWEVRGTHDGDLMGIPPTGKSATTYGCGMAEFGEDGLIHRAGNYWNAAALLQQLGVLPETAGATA